jgi:hypothetical protein
MGKIISLSTGNTKEQVRPNLFTPFLLVSTWALFFVPPIDGQHESLAPHNFFRAYSETDKPARFAAAQSTRYSFFVRRCRNTTPLRSAAGFGGLPRFI